MDINDMKKMMKESGINDINDLVQDIDYLKLIMLLGKLDRNKIKKALGDVDIAETIQAAKDGDKAKIKKAVNEIDFDLLKEVVDADGDGDVADDIKRIIKKVKK